MSVHIIAEAGSNYNGSVELACKLNQVAADAGADSVKYQIIYPEGLYRQAVYTYGHYDIKEVLRIRQEGVLSDEDWKRVYLDAKARGILFSSSVFDLRGLDLLMEMDPPYLKTASSDLNNIRFLRELASRGKKMIVSTGMATLSEIEKSVDVIVKQGLPLSQIVLMHCVSAYPTSLDDTNLAFIETLKNTFGTSVGFSDHTQGNEAACVAVGLGVEWIEKHYTLDNTLPGFDHKYAMEPSQFANYVSSIRAVEVSLAPQDQKIGDAEAYTKQRARRGMYVSKSLPAGHILTDQDILIVRPENSIPASDIDVIIGMQLLQPLDAFDPLSMDILVECSSNQSN